MSKRQIKFRAWIPKAGIMLENVAVYDRDMIGTYYDSVSKALKDQRGEHWYMVDDQIWMDNQDSGEPEEVMELLSGEEWLFFEGNQFELMQFVGLTDKNSKEIYEGDILGYQYYKDHGQWGELEEMNPIEVKWDEKKAAFDPLYYWKSYNDQLKTCVVIGNIYETDNN